MNNAFVGELFNLNTQQNGPLSGLKFAVKDLIDVAGFVTGGGNPTWTETHPVATHHAPCVMCLLEEGANCIAKTITDELAYSLEGRNHFFGTPLNPNWPHAMSGGSSSGSASAVAQRIVDFALGTDTGGSVRVPAAFCGIWGIRPTHGSIPLEGVLPFASCFDTVGWFAYDVDTFLKVGDVLLPEDQSRVNLHSLPILGVAEAFDALQQQTGLAAIFKDYAEKLEMQNIQSVFPIALEEALACYQYLQDASIKENLGEWISQNSPEFGPSMQRNFERVMLNDGQNKVFYQLKQQSFAKHIDALLEKNILILPTTPMPLLHLNIDETVLSQFYQNALTINAIAGLAGVPQVNIPIANTHQYPIALSIIGPRYSDRALIKLAKHLFSSANLSSGSSP